MNLATTRELPSSSLPFSEQLLRLIRLRDHLGSFLCRYSFEPQTEAAFREREALREELNALEDRCRKLSGLLKNNRDVLGSLKKDLLNLHLEFNRLERKVRRYLDQG